MFAERTKLYAALAPILGLERLEDAQRRLQQAQKSLSTAKETASQLAKELRPVLGSLGDERAGAVLGQLAKRAPDLDVVQALVTAGTTAPGDDLAQLRAIAALQGPDPVAFRRTVDRYDQARTVLAGLEEGALAADVRRCDLLASALVVHQEHGDGLCPVCSVGTLDADWARRVEAELELEREGAQARAAARQDVAAAGRALVAAVTAGPESLTCSSPALRDQVAPVMEAWTALRSLAADPAVLAREGAAALSELHLRLGIAVLAARVELQRKEDLWQPVAVRVAEWLRHARRAAEEKDRLAAVKAAATWLKDNAHQLRNARIRPLAERAKHIWGMLRQESNVDLGEITLAGSSNQRRVELAAAVDGVAVGALGVMSQGELHALALALFLPKATVATSPFGFVVIDDPVQAMDPAKVDGLARVLEEVAADRQVIVFTHDDRLPEAVRRLGIDARLVEVIRDHNSRCLMSIGPGASLR